MKVWNNGRDLPMVFGSTMVQANYVEIIVSLMQLNNGEYVWNVSANVFHQSSRYDALIELNEDYKECDKAGAIECASQLAVKYGLEYDDDNMHRSRIWAA